MKITQSQFETMQAEIANAKQTMKQFAALEAEKSRLQLKLGDRMSLRYPTTSSPTLRTGSASIRLTKEFEAARIINKNIGQAQAGEQRYKKRAEKMREQLDTETRLLFAEMKLNDEIRKILGADKDDGLTKELAERIMAELEQMRSENDQLKAVAQASAVTL